MVLSPDKNRVVLSAVVFLFAAVTVIRFEFGSVGDGYTLLYVLPIALAGLQFGLGGGLMASALAIGLVVVWTRADNVGLTAMGYLTRSMAFVVLGGLVGFETRQIRRAESEREELLARVEAIARTDGLTGLANRRAWDEALRLEIERARAGVGRLLSSLCSISTASSATTMSTVTRPGMSCCGRRRSAGGRRFVRSIPWRATAARSSRCSFP